MAIRPYRDSPLTCVFPFPFLSLPIMIIVIIMINYNQQMKRNPTSVEAFDISQSNSEHSRHWFFKGGTIGPASNVITCGWIYLYISHLCTCRLVIDGKEVEESLMDLVIGTLEANRNNSLIAFRYGFSFCDSFVHL